MLIQNEFEGYEVSIAQPPWAEVFRNGVRWREACMLMDKLSHVTALVNAILPREMRFET